MTEEQKHKQLDERIKHASVVALYPPDPIVHDVETILPADDAPALIFGPPASLKSWLAIAMCDAIVRGGTFLGLKTRKRTRALYVNLDAGEKAFLSRVQSISNAPNFSFVSLDASEFTDDYQRHLFEQFAGGFIVIDCLSAFYRADRQDDPAVAMRQFVGKLRALYAEHRCGGGVIDHGRRPNARGDRGDYYGSVQKEASFRTMWEVEPLEDGDEGSAPRARIVCRKLSEGPKFGDVKFEVDFSGPRVAVSRVYVADNQRSPAKADRRPSVQAAILKWAGEQLEPFSQNAACASVTGYGSPLKRTAFRELVDDGALVEAGSKGGHALYTMTAPGAPGAPGAQSGTVGTVRNGLALVGVPGAPGTVEHGGHTGA